VYLQSGTSQQGTGSFNTSLSQQGTIPENAESLQLTAWSVTPGNADFSAYFSVSFSGNSLSPVLLSSEQSPSGSGQFLNVYGFNIESYADQNGQIELTAMYPYAVEFDDILFSASAVPEPGIITLTAIGGLLFGARKWFARR
jgi:hypothetical protein